MSRIYLNWDQDKKQWQLEKSNWESVYADSYDNENLQYGYSVDINDLYAVIGNRSAFTSGSNTTGTGSVIVFKKSSQTDLYEQYLILKKQYDYADVNYLAINDATGSILGPDLPATESLFTLDFDANSALISADGYGASVCLSGSTLVVGCP